MRELFRYPGIQAARTAASYRLLSPNELHSMGVAHIERTLAQQEYKILFQSGSPTRFPQLKAFKKGECLWWVVVEAAMYPHIPQLSDDVGLEVLKYARSEEALVMYAPVMFINTKSQNLSLPSQNGTFSALFNGFIEVSKQSLREGR
ncbi:hypothetical protein [Sphaerochaeta globosa]|uniref:Uncharacterized protein n=1 Tax=Sphaerochaeta globosa (strain ATCC BAA-1886 / DSM 22777 / Buddy) TaxID=158189 RepID=F0RWD8_SPHGB|nr:hypothetical protein [Sphaerochaeta globosa]ADY13569.1 hypothetical protein SpiBuddy_1745 [Sphaerochaeta globosa str. Buddy]